MANDTGAQRETEFLTELYVLDFQRNAQELAAELGVALADVRQGVGAGPPGRRVPQATVRRVARSTGTLLLNRHVLRFLDSLAPLLGRVKVAVGALEAHVICDINDYGMGYVIYCDPALVRLLNEIGASLEVIVHPGDDPQTSTADMADLGCLPEED